MCAMCKQFPLLWILVCCLTTGGVASVCRGNDTAMCNMSRRDVLQHLLNKTDTNNPYDPRVPPDYEKNFATNISIRVHVLSFDSVSETTMDYSVDLYLTMKWVDERLNYTQYHDAKWLEVDTKMMNDIWVPDVYFRNAKEANFHEVTVPNKYMHIYRDAEINYSMRLSLTLSCRMQLEKYPLDTQKCPMLIQSYTYTTENVRFHWHEPNPITKDAEIVLHTELPQFSIVSNKTSKCNGTMDASSPSFACIRAHFVLERDLGFYIIQVYVPSILIVALSWVSFWLDLEAIPARVSLGVLTVLTLNTHGSNIQSQLPKVSYIKAIDVWVVSSLIFVFAALLEFAYVNVLARRGDKEMACQVYNLPLEGGEFPKRKESVGGHSSFEVNGNRPKHAHDKRPPSQKKARQVDKIARLIFPVAFAIFNTVYWVYYIYV